MMEARYLVRDFSELLSPSLLIYPALVRQNFETMIEMAKGPARLRPHVKTHKMAEIVRLAESLGIHKHKCATIAEAEMVAAAGGCDVLLSYPLVGPNVKRFTKLVRAYRNAIFRATVDNPDSARALSAAAEGLEQPIPVLIDLEIGMGRTGIAPGDAAAELYALIDRLPNLVPDGLHAYDGHIHDHDLAGAGKQRTQVWQARWRCASGCSSWAWPYPVLLSAVRRHSRRIWISTFPAWSSRRVRACLQTLDTVQSTPTCRSLRRPCF